MSKNLRPTRRKLNARTIDEALRRAVDKAGQAHQRTLEHVVSPLESPILFSRTAAIEGGDLILRVVPLANVITQENGTIITGASLFFKLEDGFTSQARMPKGFSPETVANSLASRHVTYDRGKIYIDTKRDPYEVEARNWSHLTAVLHRNELPSRVKAALQKRV